MNTFGWIDFSKRDRDLARDIIASLSTPGALDELGIGVIRDGFADYFFPGTSTVQTIPKYFFLVAYQLDELSRNPTGNLEQRLREMERQCSRKMWDSLTPEEQESGNTGVFGSTFFKGKDASSKEWVKRQPSSVYWNGIRKLGFLSCSNNNLSIADYLRIIKKVERPPVESDDDLNNDTKQVRNSACPRLWVAFPEDRGDWKKTPSTKLTLGEADFLVDQITTKLDNTLFAFLVRNRIYPLESLKFSDLNDKLHLSGQLKDDWKLANDFSEFVKPAQVFFNVLLGNEAAKKQWEKDYVPEELKTLANNVELDLVFHVVQPPNQTKDFLRSLKDIFLNLDEEKLMNLLTMREKRLKGETRMKIGKENPYYRDHWAGGFGFEYRYSDACHIIRDIRIAKGEET